MRGFELGAELGERVDLPVLDHTDGAVLVLDRLVAALDVDDRQPAHTERRVPVQRSPGVIGPTPIQRGHHAIESLTRERAVAAKVDEASYPAHRVWCSAVILRV